MCLAPLGLEEEPALLSPSPGWDCQASHLSVPSGCQPSGHRTCPLLEGSLAELSEETQALDVGAGSGENGV